jgi:protocatechuate 3,4-dioxygenase beta subunit
LSVRAEPLQEVDDDERATRDADPPYLSPDYVGTRLRSPRRPLLLLPERLSELTGPAFGSDDVRGSDSDLTTQHSGEPLGERIIVSGRVLASDGRPVRKALLEIWQANAAGRYLHRVDQHPAPLDPNFTGGGRVLTDDEGRYRFITVKPGSYPWMNHHNAWRPAHFHLSIFGLCLIHI